MYSLDSAPPAGPIFEHGGQRHVADVFVFVLAEVATSESIAIRRLGVEIGQHLIHEEQVCYPNWLPTMSEYQTPARVAGRTLVGHDVQRTCERRASWADRYASVTSTSLCYRSRRT